MTWKCGGCGARTADAFPLTCPGAQPGDDIDHVLCREGPALGPPSSELNPFLRFRRQLPSYALARANGLTDEDYVALVEGLDARVRQVEGRGFKVTPLLESATLASTLGLELPVVVKDLSLIHI